MGSPKLSTYFFLLNVGVFNKTKNPVEKMEKVKTIILLLSCISLLSIHVNGIGANWGTQTSHPLPPDTVVQLLKENGFSKVKIFDAEEGTMNALKKSGLEVMVGIPNDMLRALATSVKFAENWVSKNVSAFINDGVNIRYYFLFSFGYFLF
jgi:glucan endo-1,3-beta-glucosidase 5/6